MNVQEFEQICNKSSLTNDYESTFYNLFMLRQSTSKAFAASITGTDKQNLWFRGIYFLSTISEEICLTISNDFLIASALNSTYTGSCKIKFDRNFFDDFEFRPHEIVFGEAGLQAAKDPLGNIQKLYSILINGKHLTTISKISTETGIINEFSLSVDNTLSCSESMANRLLVTIEMESLIQKEYSPQFTPTQYNPLLVDLKYKRKFVDVFGTTETRSANEQPVDPKLVEICNAIESGLSKELFYDAIANEPRQGNFGSFDEINYICCNQALMKNFIENCNTSLTDEIKIQVDTRRLIMTAFTKSIYGKGNDILKSAISMSNTIALTALEHCSLFWVEDESLGSNAKSDRQLKSIVFKSKDFRNFIGINSYSRQNIFSGGNMNIWFCNPGDPILIELDRENVRFQLLQVTDATSNSASINQSVELSRTSNTASTRNSSMTPLKTMAPPLQHSISIKREVRNSPLRSILPTEKLTDNQSSHSTPKRKLFVRDEDSSDEEEHRAINQRGDRMQNSAESYSRNNLASNSNQGNESILGMDKTITVNRSNTIIKWGAPHSTTNDKQRTHDEIGLLREKRKRLLDEDHNDSTSRKQKSSSSEQFGPTQPELPKGLLD
ncbi:DNA damage checkpoint protein 1 [Nakaseomyces bracarensis]|uniref:DNA damage checkpoint protein 1 n=1 Tax=Nakaseomyces bracarensis TaxID=273131 RepID=A0ABR4NVS3_9SACH